jgi:hypothetical protein
LAATTKANYASTVRTKHFTELLDIAMGRMPELKFAVSHDVEKGAGDTVRVARLLRPAKTTSAATQGTLIAASSATNLVANHLDLSLQNWGNSFGFNEDVDITSWISMKSSKETIANQMQRTLAYQLRKIMSTQSFRWRIDGDTDYQKMATVTTADTTTGGAVSFHSTGLSETTADYWTGGYVTITNPESPNYDITSFITDYATDAATVSFPNSLTTDSDGWLCATQALAATDVMTTTGLLYVAALHELFETEKFDGGLLRGFLAPAQKRDLWLDTTFLNSAIYDNSGRFANYSVIRWWDMEFLVGSEGYRESVMALPTTAAISTYELQASGVVYSTPIFGANSYALYSFANPGGSGKFSVSWQVVDTPDAANLRNSAKFLSWKSQWAGGVLRATSIINLLTGATSLAVTV